MRDERELMPARLPNLRDLGGLRTDSGATLQRGRLLRSAALVDISPTTAEALTTLTGPGIYVDLRTEREVTRDGAPTGLCDHGWRWHRLPVADRAEDDHGDTPQDFLRRYFAALPRYLDVVRNVIPVLGNKPVIIACALGKDRTGLVTALLLRWLGIRRAEILADFALSNGYLQRQRHLLPARFQDPDVLIHAVSEAVCADVLDWVDREEHRLPPRPQDTEALLGLHTRLLVES